MTNDVSAQVRLAFLLDAWSRAKDGANTLLATLQADSSAALAIVKPGALSSLGKNSAHQTYMGYHPGSLTQVQVVEVISDLISSYEQIAAQIVDQFTDDTLDWPNGVPNGFDFDEIIADPTIDPTTGESKGILVRVLKGQCSGVSQLRPDITRLRLPDVAVLSPPPLTTW